MRDGGLAASARRADKPAGNPASDDQVRELRSRLAASASGGDVLVGGQAAEGVDLLDRIDDAGRVERPGDHARAPAQRTPITLAALIMMIVFLSSATAQVETFRQLGVGMALAVFLDATLIRCALVPAALALLGERNWWLPRTAGTRRRLELPRR